MGDVVETVEKATFVKRKHELADVLKAVQRGSTDAVELIINTMNETDEEKVTLKTRLQLAQDLLELQVKLAQVISEDQLKRQIAEIKVNGASTPLEALPGERKRLPPTTDFTTIQEVK